MNLREAIERAKKGDLTLLKESPTILATQYGTDKTSALHELASRGVTKILELPKELLLKQDVSERTPCHYLAMNADVKSMVGFPQESFSIQDEDGKTPLHYLAERIDVSSANPKFLKIQEYENNQNPFMIMAECGVDFDITKIPNDILKQKSSLGETVAHYLAYNGNKKALDIESLKNVKNLSGATPISILKEKGVEVTSKFHPWIKMKVKIIPEKYIDVLGYKFYWNENGGKRIYTHTFNSGDTLTFSLYRKKPNIEYGITAMDLDGTPAIAKVSGSDNDLKKTLVDWLKQQNVSIIDIKR